MSSIFPIQEKPEVDNCKAVRQHHHCSFCPESKLSGVNYTDFIEQMWYQRSISIPENWKGKKYY